MITNKIRDMKIRILPSKIIPLMYSVRILRIQLLALIMSGCVVTASIPSSRHGVVYNYDEYYIYGGEVYYYTPYSHIRTEYIRSTYRVPVYYPHKSYAVRRYKVHSNGTNGTKYEGKQYGGKQYGGKQYGGKQYEGGKSSGRRK
jgi:hypothetical protein